MIFQPKKKSRYKKDGTFKKFWIVRCAFSPNGPFWESEKQYVDEWRAARAAKKLTEKYGGREHAI